MALRMISFGYKMINGVLEVAEEEERIVVEIFQRYGAGEILKTIADDLTKRQIVFYQEKTVWNKKMIARIIGNRRYIGEGGYPRIVNDEDFERANKLKSQKGVKKVVYSEEVEYLKDALVCAQCGHKIYRHPTWSLREKWFCTAGCKNDIYIGDKELTCGILNALTNAKAEQSCLEICGTSDTYHPSVEVVRENKEINRLIDQPNVQFQAVKKLIFQCAEKKFMCCSDNMADAHTRYIQQCFAEWEVSDTLNVAFMNKVAEQISLEKDGAVTITLINKAEIKGRR